MAPPEDFPKQYSGPLTKEQAEKGIRAAINNSRALLSDAQLLLENGRCERAGALAILALEEIGKVIVVRLIYESRDEKQLKLNWRDYRSHKRKNFSWLLPLAALSQSSDILNSSRKLEDLLEDALEDLLEDAQVFDAVKQALFYSDAVARCQWREPSSRKEVVSDFVRSLVRSANLLIGGVHKALIENDGIKSWLDGMTPKERPSWN